MIDHLLLGYFGFNQVSAVYALNLPYLNATSRKRLLIVEYE